MTTCPAGTWRRDERATLRGVIGVPLEWRGRIIGACIVFSRDERRVFGPDDAELLQLFAKHAAIALANARMHEAAEERARAEAAAAERDRLLPRCTTRSPSGWSASGCTWTRPSATWPAGDAGRGRAVGGRHRAGQRGGQGRPGRGEADAARPVRLAADGQTLDAALRSEAAWAESIGRLEVRFVSAGTPVALEEQLAREVLRVAREALTNIVRHAGARTRPARAAVRAGGRVAAGPGRRPGLRPAVRLAGRPLRAARHDRARARVRRDGRRRLAGRLGHPDPGPLSLPA